MSIRSQVMRAIDQRISEAQSACDAEIKLLKESKKSSINKAFTQLSEQIKHAISFYKTAKAEVESRHVNSILSKIL